MTLLGENGGGKSTVLESQARYTNFLSQFNEDEPLTTLERWMVYNQSNPAGWHPLRQRQQRGETPL